MIMTLIHATCFFLMLMLIIGYPSGRGSLSCRVRPAHTGPGRTSA